MGKKAVSKSDVAALQLRQIEAVERHAEALNRLALAQREAAQAYREMTKYGREASDEYPAHLIQEPEQDLSWEEIFALVDPENFRDAED